MTGACSWPGSSRRRDTRSHCSHLFPKPTWQSGQDSSDYLYGKTNYTYIETTNLSFVGVPPQHLENNITLQSDPVVIPIGDGMKIYHTGSENRYINEMDSLSIQEVKELEPQLKSLEPELNTEKEKIQQLESAMMQMKSAGDVRDYNAKVSDHNALVSDYNNRLEGYRQTLYPVRELRTRPQLHHRPRVRPGRGIQYVKTNMPA